MERDEEVAQRLRERWTTGAGAEGAASPGASSNRIDQSSAERGDGSTTGRRTTPEGARTQPTRPQNRRRPSASSEAASAGPALAVAGAAYVFLGFGAAALQTSVWILFVFEAILGGAVALALTPYRRSSGCSEESLNRATILSVCAVYAVYLFTIVIVFNMDPFSTSIRSIRTMGRIGWSHGPIVSLLVLGFKVAVSMVTAKVAIRVLHDEHLDQA